MVKTHNSLKKSIFTILHQLSLRTKGYPPSEQNRLKFFLVLIQHYEEADFDRKTLVNRFTKYGEETLQDEEYLSLPFLWFTGTYTLNARVLLQHSKFHATPFYEFIAKHLRRVFRLVNSSQPLSSMLWEELQYDANKLLGNLTKRDIETIMVEFRLLKEKGVIALSLRQQKEYIADYIEFSKKEKPFVELNRLFTILNGKWFLRFHSPAFDLSRVFFEFKTLGSTSLNDVIDFTNHENTTLTTSDIYHTREDPNRFLGFLIIPNGHISELQTHLMECQNNGNIILEKYSPVTDIRKSTSLRLYQPEKGWLNTNSSFLSRLRRCILSNGSEVLEQSTSSNLNDIYIPDPLNNKWSYRNHPLPHRIIELYCKISNEYSFRNLPINFDKIKKPSDLTIDELGLLKQLYYNKVVYPGFVPWQIVYEFSLNNFCVYLPKIPFSNLKELIKILPFSEVYFTEDIICLFSRLTVQIANWIQSKLGWETSMITIVQKPIELNLEWFNKELLNWEVPEVLSSKEKKEG